jgi:hypothetical protein
LSESGIEAKTKNIAALTFEIRPGLAPFRARPVVELDGQKLHGAPLQTDRSWRAHFRKAEGKWKLLSEEEYAAQSAAPEKRPGLQGPIDDAFMDSFVMVVPGGTGLNEKVSAWVRAEQERAIREWRRQFRGEARVVKDTEVTADEMAWANLVLWGDPASNEVLRKIAAQLPLQWSAEGIKLGSQSYSAESHVPALICPNPLNPKHYVVVNSGVTFREYDYLNNARQVAKLPDYAVFDLSVPPNARYAGKVVSAGFFDENWKLKESLK